MVTYLYSEEVLHERLPMRPVKKRKEAKKMVEISWEKDFKTALEKAKKTGKPIYHDFWFDG
jgi:hypothetical protein